MTDPAPEVPTPPADPDQAQPEVVPPSDDPHEVQTDSESDHTAEELPVDADTDGTQNV